VICLKLGAMQQSDILFESNTRGNFKQLVGDNILAQEVLLDDMIQEMAGKQTKRLPGENAGLLSFFSFF